MKKKYIINYLLLFIITLLILLISFVLVAKIPKNSIKQNNINSLDFYKKNPGVTKLEKNNDYAMIHYYADTILLNVNYHLDGNNALKSVMESKFYRNNKTDSNIDYIHAVENDIPENTEYMRYWHGSLVIIRPLLTMFNMEKIYLINKVLLYMLAVILGILLFRKSKILSFIYIISMIMIAFYYVPFAIEYSTTFYIMFISSILILLLDKKDDKYVYIIFALNGIITCFVDFLTTEIITLFFPLIIFLFLKFKNKKIKNFKTGFKVFFKCCLLWSLFYVGMWFAKWILASIILNVNAYDFVKYGLSLRINGNVFFDNWLDLRSNALISNINTLIPLTFINNIYVNIALLCIILLIIFLVLKRKKLKNRWFSLILIIIGFTPYFRYFVIGNHSYFHHSFTFRSQIITIMCIGLLIYNLFSKDVKK